MQYYVYIINRNYNTFEKI